MALAVVIADDHHHVLPEIHLAIRQRRLPFDGVHVVHVDAHPDLSFPRSVDAAVVFQPEALYDMLDASESGIAEFLLPLVFAGHVSQITWIKPPWASQMPVGAFRAISIGKRAVDGSMALTCPLPHFLDDELYCAPDGLQPDSQRAWDLFVTEIDTDRGTISSGDDEAGVLAEALEHARQECKEYVLDIDLDYFSTWNPFRQELEGEFNADDLATVAQVFSRLRYKRADLDMTVEQRLHDRRAFLAAMRAIETCADASLHQHGIVDGLASLYPSDFDALSMLRAFSTFIGTLSKRQVERVIGWAGPNMDLPHHESSPEEIAERVERFSRFLENHSMDRAHPPALITIAKSSGDEFLPPHQADSALDAVLAVLEHAFGPLDRREVEYEPADDDSSE